MVRRAHKRAPNALKPVMILCMVCRETVLRTHAVFDLFSDAVCGLAHRHAACIHVRHVRHRIRSPGSPLEPESGPEPQPAHGAPAPLPGLAPVPVTLALAGGGPAYRARIIWNPLRRSQYPALLLPRIPRITTLTARICLSQIPPVRKELACQNLKMCTGAGVKHARKSVLENTGRAHFQVPMLMPVPAAGASPCNICQNRRAQTSHIRPYVHPAPSPPPAAPLRHLHRASFMPGSRRAPAPTAGGSGRLNPGSAYFCLDVTCCEAAATLAPHPFSTR